MLTLLIALSSVAVASEGDDPQVWLNASVEHEVVDDLEVSLSEHLRLAPLGDAVVTDLLTDLAVDWKAKKWLKFGASYRIGAEDFDGSPRLVQRLAVDSSQKIRAGRLRVSFRERFQFRLPTAKPTVRVRARAQLKLSGPDPYVQVEPWFRPLASSIVRKVRFETGVKVKVRDWLDLKPYYRLDVPMADATDPRIHVVGLAASFEVERKKGPKSARNTPPEHGLVTATPHNRHHVPLGVR